ncbi:MAG: twin-arginine translocase subunit TatC [Anaerolineae bacterium]|nr:twin-arginine translocase subunit TatC [Anaerolineae bacterium]
MSRMISTPEQLNQGQLPEDEDFQPGAMSLLGHFDELRIRLVRSFIAVIAATFIVAIVTPQIFEILMAPYGDKLLVLKPTESISVYFRVALTGGLALAMPYLVYHVLMFILPGLEENEKRYIVWGVPMATLLFLIGAAFAWFLMLPTAINFLKNWQSDIFIQQWQSKEYIPFVTSLTFWIGVSFEIPLIIFIMAKVGLVTPKFLMQQWRFAIVIVAIIAAMITPTIDPFNMALVMGPLLGLYGLSILFAYLA